MKSKKKENIKSNSKDDGLTMLDVGNKKSKIQSKSLICKDSEKFDFSIIENPKSPKVRDLLVGLTEEDKDKIIKQFPDNIIAKDVKNNNDSIIEDYDVTKKTGFDISKIITKIKENFLPHKVFLIKMELLNGMHRQFVVFIDEDCFIYNKKAYVVDHSLKYYDVSAKKYCLDYHEGFSLPIARRYKVEELRKLMQKTGVSNVDEATNPRNLSQFIRSKVIEMLMQGGEMDKFFKFIKLMTIITAISSTLVLLIKLNESGAFRQFGF